MGSSHNTTMRRRFAGLVLAASMVSVGLGITSVSAQSSASCTGDVVLEFTAIRLLNLEGHRSAGPFSVDLEPGVYIVTAGSFDMHGPDQLTQPQEQWQVRSDGGWSSPFTIDVPDDQQFTVTRFVQQNVTRAVSSITLEHLGQGGINSVDPTCVGFTLVSSADDDCSSSDPDATVDSDGNVTCDASSDDSTDDPTDIAAPGTDDSSEPADPPAAPGTDDSSQPADPPAAPGTDDSSEPADPPAAPGTDDSSQPADGAGPDDCADGGVAGDLVDDLNPDAAEDCGDDDPAVANPTPGDPDDGDDPDAADPRPTPDPGDDPAVATPTPGDPDDGDDPDAADPAPIPDPDDDDDDPAVATPAPGDDPDANPPAANDPDDDEVEVEVAGAVEEATELARTGTGPLTNRVFGMALVLLGLGGLTTLWSRREDLGFS